MHALRPRGIVAFAALSFGLHGLAASAGAADQPPGWRWRLTGVMTAPGLHEALFARGRATWAVREGAQIDGWTLTAVGPQGVTLHAGDTDKTLSVEGFAPDEAMAAAAERAILAEQASVEAALSRQSHEQQAAETALIDATKAMAGH